MAPPINAQRIFHRSPVMQMFVAIGDQEAHKRRMDKADELVKELSTPYQQNDDGELVENSTITVNTVNMGDVSDHGTSPLYGYEWAAAQGANIAGNRDLNYLRGYELDTKYIDFVYNTLADIVTRPDDHPTFYHVGKLKKGDAWLAAAEASKLRYPVPGTDPEVTLPLPHIDGTPTGMNFYT
ncbi:MAG TPA: hypothetical protein VI522_08010, partial [Gammaproteobacteria bacterium]|nr:hypothetical protein [Gammaproteobacteria bacterium]